jgi:hypothetical protein
MVTLCLLYWLNPQSPFWYASVGAVFVLFLVIGVGSLRIGRLFRDGVKSAPVMHQEFQLEVRDDGVLTNTAIAESFRRWPAFTDVAETPHLFLLSVGGEQRLWLPKRAFSEPDISQVRTVLTANIPSKWKS